MSRNRVAIELALGRLRTHPRLDAQTQSAFERLALHAPDVDVLHINPYAIAGLEHLDQDTQVHACIAAEQCGVLEAQFNSLCVFCGAVELRFERMEQAPTDHFRCSQCDSDIAMRGGERLEVSFRLKRTLGTLDFDPFASMANYRRWFISPCVIPAMEFGAFMMQALKARALVAPEQSTHFDVHMGSGESLRVFSYDRHASVTLLSDDSANARTERGFASEQTVTFTHAATGGGRVPPGNVSITVRNDHVRALGVFVIDGNAQAYHHAMQTHPPTRKPFLDAKVWREKYARY